MKVYEIFKEKIKASGLSTPEDTVIIAPLLHDICKTNYYKVDYRNAKNARGEWEKVPYYAVEDTIPYGHGEKSVMMITEYMKLTNEEKYAIRWHMGFTEPKELYGTIGEAYKKYPIALLLNEADLEATYFYTIYYKNMLILNLLRVVVMLLDISYMLLQVYHIILLVL